MEALRIYWAGDLFDHKDLIGNLLLARAVEKVSQGRYLPVLPQASEANSERCGIRDSDYDLLLSCDLYLGNFDGDDLDSGTVAEFMFAKMLDYPAVLLRTDFRRNCEDPSKGVPWNLMCSDFPRCRPLILHGMNLLHETGAGKDEPVSAYLDEIAKSIVRELDAVRTGKALFERDALFAHYQHCIRALGGKVAQLWPEERLKALLDSKTEKGVY